MLTVRMKSYIDLCNQTYALPTKSISTSLPFSPSPPPPPLKRERDDPLWEKKIIAITSVIYVFILK